MIARSETPAIDQPRLRPRPSDAVFRSVFSWAWWEASRKFLSMTEQRLTLAINVLPDEGFLRAPSWDSNGKVLSFLGLSASLVNSATHVVRLAARWDIRWRHTALAMPLGSIPEQNR